MISWTYCILSLLDRFSRIGGIHHHCDVVVVGDYNVDFDRCNPRAKLFLCLFMFL